MKFSAALTALSFPSFANAVLFSGSIQITNLAPTEGTGGVRISPLWIALHDGDWDTFNMGEPASPGLEEIAELGSSSVIHDEFDAFLAGGGGVYQATLPGATPPGTSQQHDFTIDVPDPTAGLYFSYASMIVPSNDAFIGNNNPTAYPIISQGSGDTLRLEFTIEGDHVYDAGTELNDEVVGNAAIPGTGPPGSATGGGPGEGSVDFHPGYIPGGSLITQFPNADFTQPGYQVARIIVIINRGDQGPFLGAGSFADPHFRLWNKRWYDFMGACDLHLLRAPQFTESSGLEVDIRTKIRYDYSYIEAAALKLNGEVFQVSSFGEYFLNGVESVEQEELALAGFPIKYSNPNEKEHIFELVLSEEDSIIVSTFKDMVSVKLDSANPDRLNGSLGMLGSFDHSGSMVGRDGKTIIEDPEAFAAEWQVKADEPMLFQTAKAPQHPQQCVMPSAKATAARKRRLGESNVLAAAEIACANWEEDIRSACVHDVVATGDLDLAAAGAF